MANGTTFAITISSEINEKDGFEYGATFTDKAEIARYYRLVYNAVRPGKQLTLPDDVVFQVVKSVDISAFGDEYVDIDDARDDALEDAQKRADAGENVLPDLHSDQVVREMSSLAISIEARARELADAINADENVTQYLDVIVDSIETGKYGPVLLIDKLTSNPTIKALMDNAPVPGTTAEDVAKTNQPDNYDKYKKPVVVDGETKMKPSSFYGELAANLNKAVHAFTMVDKISAVQKKTVGADADLSKLGVNELKAMKARYRVRSNNYRQQVITAVSVHQQMQRAQNMIGLKIYYVRNQSDKALTWTPNPIGVYEKEEPTTCDVFTLQQFRNMDIDAAIAAGGTLAALKATIGRETGSADTGYKTPTNIETGQDMLNVFASYMLDHNVFTQWLTLVGKPEGAEAITALTQLSTRIETILAAKPQATTGKRDKLIEGAAKRTGTK